MHQHHYRRPAQPQPEGRQLGVEGPADLRRVPQGSQRTALGLGPVVARRLQGLRPVLHVAFQLRPDGLPLFQGGVADVGEDLVVKVRHGAHPRAGAVDSTASTPRA